MSSPENCHVCFSKGKTSRLRVYQINFDEAVRFCEDDKCTYPAGQLATDSLILNRKYTDISPKKTTQKVTPTTLQKSQPINAKLRSRSHIPCLPSIKKILDTPINRVCSPTGKRPLTPYIPGKSKQNHDREILATKTTLSYQEEENIKSKSDWTFFPQWQNKEAMCWLDVVICLFVHCKNLQENLESYTEDDKTVLKTLLIAYNQACKILNNGLDSKQDSPKLDLTKVEYQQPVLQTLTASQRSSDIVQNFQQMSVVDKVKTGAGIKFSSEINKEMNVIEDRYLHAFNILQDVRETVFLKLQPKLQCVKGKNDSPLFAIPLLVKGDSVVEKLMRMKYRFDFHCKACGYMQSDSFEQVLPTLPKPPQNIAIAEPTVERSCFKCRAPWQQRKMIFEKLPEVVVLHFVEGLQSNDIESLSFSFRGRQYRVRGLIQYLNNPDHFVTWIHNAEDMTWMECDDLKSPVCQPQKVDLRIPAQQIHIVMWESFSTAKTKDIPVKMEIESPAQLIKEMKNNKINLQSSDTGSVGVDSPMSVDTPTEDDCQDSVKALRSSSLKPNMVVKLTHTGQLIQVQNQVTSTPSPNYSPVLQNSSSLKVKVPKRVGKTAATKNQPDAKSSPALSNPVGSYTPSFLKSLIQKKSKNSLVLQAESRAGKSPSFHGSTGAIARLRGLSATNFRPPVLGKKKFEGYFSQKNCKSNTPQGSGLFRSSSVYSLSGDSSRANSPTLSSFSDTYTLQKRKFTDMEEMNSKRRKSICSDSSTSSPESFHVEELIDVPTSEGCDVLQNLYNALNLSLPENLEIPHNTKSIKSANAKLCDEESLPDVQDLAGFIENSNDNNVSSLDDFLAQL